MGKIVNLPINKKPKDNPIKIKIEENIKEKEEETIDIPLTFKIG